MDYRNPVPDFTFRRGDWLFGLEKSLQLRRQSNLLLVIRHGGRGHVGIGCFQKPLQGWPQRVPGHLEDLEFVHIRQPQWQLI